MPTIRKLTESQLADVLEDFYVRVRAGNGAMGTSTAQLADADETAKAIFAALDRTAALREDDGAADSHVCCHPSLADAELAPTAAIIAAMDSLPDEGDITTTGAPWRVLQYVASRYGFVLCTAD